MEITQSTYNLLEIMPNAAMILSTTTQKITFANKLCHQAFPFGIGDRVEVIIADANKLLEPEEINVSIRNQLQAQQRYIWPQIGLRMRSGKVQNYDINVSYVDRSMRDVYLVFSPSAQDRTQMETEHKYYEIISSTSFSYPFFLDIRKKRIEFFGPIAEQFHLPPVMENFPEPVLVGGMLLEEDLPAYHRMVDRMYRGDPPRGTFRSYTPEGDILQYTVNYVVKRDENGEPIELIGDFVNQTNTSTVSEEEVKKNSQNHVLVHQIKAHFFFNTLNTISALCKQDAAKADDAIRTFAAYMRSYMYLINEEKNIPFEQELSLVKSSLEIEKLRFPGSFTYSLDLGYDDFEIPPLSLQPIVENALLHGLRKTGHHGELKISTEKVGESVRVVVSDNGLGFDTSILDQSDSIGLNNLKKRIKLMSHGSVQIESQLGQGTEVVIALPTAG